MSLILKVFCSIVLLYSGFNLAEVYNEPENSKEYLCKMFGWFFFIMGIFGIAVVIVGFIL